MTNGPRHYKEEIQELLDQKLSAEARAEVEKHLETCVECRRELEALRWTKQFAGQHFEPATLPRELQTRVSAILDREDQKSAGFKWAWARRPILLYALLLLAIAVPALYFLLRSPDLPSEVARDYRNLKDSTLSLERTTQDVKEMENYFSSAGVPFPTRVFDLGMMNYQLVGGRVHQVVNRRSALFVYRGPGNRVLLCQMYPGAPGELPGGAEMRENNGIRFHVYRKDGLTLVFWQEGTVMCVLASDAPGEEVIQLAFAKAVRI